MVDLKQLYQKYKQEFQDIQEARSVYLQRKKSLSAEIQKSDNRYVELLQKSITDSLHKSVEDLIRECQSAVDEALNNLSPDTDTNTMQSLIDLEDMVISIRDELSGNQEETSTITEDVPQPAADPIEPKATKIIVVKAEDEEPVAVPVQKIISSGNNDDDEDDEDEDSESYAAAETAEAAIEDLHHIRIAKRQNNVKGTILLVTRGLQNANLQFKKMGAKAYLGLSDAKEGIFRALQEQNLSDEMEFNQKVQMIAQSLPEEEISEPKQKSKLFGFLGDRQTAKASKSLNSITERIYAQLEESNQRINEIIQNEIKSMTKTIDASEKIIRKSKDKTFENEIKQAETKKVLNHAVRIMSAMQGDRVFLVGYGEMAITKTDGQIGFIKNGSVVSKEDFTQSICGHSRMFSRKFESFARKEAFEKGLTQEQVEDKEEEIVSNKARSLADEDDFERA